VSLQKFDYLNFTCKVKFVETVHFLFQGPFGDKYGQENCFFLMDFISIQMLALQEKSGEWAKLIPQTKKTP